MTTTTTEQPAPAAESPTEIAAIRTYGLTKRFGKHAAVDQVDLLVPTGAVFGFLGPNGSGKTTTIRMLLGLITPTDGEVLLLGRRMPRGSAAALARVGSLVEGPAFHPYLSGRDNLIRLDACDATADPATRKVRIATALDRVGLRAAENKRYRQYSLGMKQRLGIAAALLQPRDLLVLDEPTNGLDPQGTREVRNLVREVAAEGMTVLISSHLLAEVEQVATHVGIMSAGRLLRQGSLEEVLGAGGFIVTVRTPQPRSAGMTLETIGLTDVEVDELTGTVTGRMGTARAEAVAPALVTQGIAITGLTVARPALEDYFVHLTGAGFDVAG
ncbi:MAG: type transport system ATP-binding protein [Actinomycetota bacterium]|jgi:ABC-2 type transport system ATP-binding protein|nr:type transport system ATP-binding protein [Actinomycetota bacterium]